MKGPGSLPASITIGKPSRLYLLDRNVLAFIKDYQKTTRSEPVSKFFAARPDNHQRLQALRSLDRDNAQFSPLLSILEGQIAKPQAAKDIRVVARKEWKAVGDFFQVGTHDAHLQHKPAFIQDLARTYSTAISEYSFTPFRRFLADCYPYLHQPIAKNEQAKVEEQLFNLAALHRLATRHPGFICAIGVLYGNADCRAVLKPKNLTAGPVLEKATYNAASDIFLPHRVQHIRNIVQSSNPRTEVVLYTFDKALLRFLESMTWQSFFAEDLQHHTRTETRLTFGPDLFPELGEADWPRLVERWGLTPSV